MTRFSQLSPRNLFDVDHCRVINNVGWRGGCLIDLAFNDDLCADTRHLIHLPGFQQGVLTNEPDLTCDHELHLFLKPSVPARGEVRLRPVRLHCTGCGVETRP